MKAKTVIAVYLISFLTLFYACNCAQKERSRKTKSSHGLDGKYLVDNVYFPQDTLVMKKLQSSDSTVKEKLMIELRGDSIFLSNYHFNGFYGKWFCSFYNASAKFENKKLFIYAQITEHFGCLDKWQKIEYRLIENSKGSLTFIKLLDTSNCKLIRVSARRIANPPQLSEL